MPRANGHTNCTNGCFATSSASAGVSRVMYVCHGKCPRTIWSPLPPSGRVFTYVWKVDRDVPALVLNQYNSGPFGGWLLLFDCIGIMRFHIITMRRKEEGPNHEIWEVLLAVHFRPQCLPVSLPELCRVHAYHMHKATSPSKNSLVSASRMQCVQGAHYWLLNNHVV